MPTDNFKFGAWQNNRPDTTNGCTFNPHRSIRVISAAENDVSSESPKTCRQQDKCKTDEYCDRNMRM